MKTDINTLEALERKLGDTEETKLLKNLVKRSRLNKLLNSYIDSLKSEAERQGGRCRFSYLNTRVPTGRWACGSDKKNTFFASINEQSIPKPHPAMWYVHKREEIEGELEEGEIQIFDWVFSLTRKGKYWMEGFTPENNVRKAFKPEPDALWVSIDFNAQELRIPAALSGEPAWVVPFQTGGDVHKSCYFQDTEYLTREGWKTALAINRDTEIAQFINGKMSWTKAGIMYRGESGDNIELIRFESSLVDCLVTKNHRMLVGWDETGPKFKTAEEIYDEGKGLEFRTGAVYRGFIEPNELVAYNGVEGFAINMIEDCVDFLRTRKGRELVIPLFVREGTVEVRKKFLLEYMGKNEWSFEEKIGKGIPIECRTEEFADQMQFLALSLGYRVVKRGTEIRISNRPAKVRPEGVTKEVWSGNTYCFKVQSGVLITRRMGKVAIAGNTAIQIWGEENYNKDKRKQAKVMNFSQLYGGTKFTVQSKLGIDDLDECQKLVDDFHNGLPTVFGYLDALVRKARKEGTVYTFFGRPRRVRFYLSSPDYKVRAFGARTVKNSKVQGTGADLTKLGALRSWKNLCNPDIHKHSRFMSQIHDEINYSIDISHFKELIKLAVKSMRIQVPGWPIIMEVGVEVGPSWGETFKMKVQEDGTIIPDYEEVPEDKQEPEEKEEEIKMEDEGEDEGMFIM